MFFWFYIISNVYTFVEEKLNSNSYFVDHTLYRLSVSEYTKMKSKNHDFDPKNPLIEIKPDPTGFRVLFDSTPININIVPKVTMAGVDIYYKRTPSSKGKFSIHYELELVGGTLIKPPEIILIPGRVLPQTQIILRAVPTPGL